MDVVLTQKDLVAPATLWLDAHWDQIDPLRRQELDPKRWSNFCLVTRALCWCPPETTENLAPFAKKFRGLTAELFYNRILENLVLCQPSSLLSVSPSLLFARREPELATTVQDLVDRISWFRHGLRIELPAHQAFFLRAVLLVVGGGEQWAIEAGKLREFLLFNDPPLWHLDSELVESLLLTSYGTALLREASIESDELIHYLAWALPTACVAAGFLRRADWLAKLLLCLNLLGLETPFLREAAGLQLMRWVRQLAKEAEGFPPVIDQFQGSKMGKPHQAQALEVMAFSAAVGTMNLSSEQEIGR